MFQPYRPSIRLSPRRHDVGAALMLKFRPKDGSTVRNRRLRGVDVLKALMLPTLCFALAFAIKEQRGATWMKPAVLATTPVPSASFDATQVAIRIAPDAPVGRQAAIGVRLTHIEDHADEAAIALPVSLSREIRVLEEEPPVDAKTAEQPAQPALRAALNLGDQALRSVHR